MKITIQNLCKTFGPKDIFTDFCLDIDTGFRVCVSGPNGCGKSTFIRMLAGVDAPDSGKIITPKGSRIGYVEQDLDEDALKSTLLSWILTVLPDWKDFWSKWEVAVQQKDEVQITKLSQKHSELELRYGYNPENRAKEILSGLGFEKHTWDQPLYRLSGGWRERAKLVRVLTAGADILLLDEPTNHLDIEAVEWLEEFLQSYEGALIFVAHDKVFMDTIGTHILYLGGLKPVFRKGTFSQFVAMREALEEQKTLERKRVAASIEKKMDFVRRFGAKASKARQASSRQKMAKKLEKELDAHQPEIKRKTLSFSWPDPPKADKVVLSIADLRFSFSGMGWLWPSLTFSIFNGQRIALVGANGAGKSTLLKVIVGDLDKAEGIITFGPHVRVGYYSQHQTESLHYSSTVLEEIRRLSDPKITEEELMSVLGLFLLGEEYFTRSVSKLSGGERSRLVLASLFLTKANFLILDEPTNHLDLESREALIKALQVFRGTIFAVAHDRYLLSSVFDEVWALSSNGLVKYEQGFVHYDEVRKNVVHLKEHSVSKDSGTRKKEETREEIKLRKREEAQKRNRFYALLRPKQEELQTLETLVYTLLEKQSMIEQQLALPEIYADQTKTRELLELFHTVKEDIEKNMKNIEKLQDDIAKLEKQSL